MIMKILYWTGSKGAKDETPSLSHNLPNSTISFYHYSLSSSAGLHAKKKLGSVFCKSRYASADLSIMSLIFFFPLSTS